MERWAKHWASFPLRFPPGDHLRQVGKTVGGRPIAASRVERIVHSIVTALDLDCGDRLLDLCCGNGLLSARLAGHCARVVAVDYSKPLIEIARRDHRRPNLVYLHTSALELDGVGAEAPFDKVLMYEALQHFVPAELPVLLRVMEPHTAPVFRLMLGSVPDRGRRDRFYDTPRRRLVAWLRGLAGHDALGTWWERDELASSLAGAGLDARFSPQPPELHTAHYRFDVVAAPRAAR